MDWMGILIAALMSALSLMVQHLLPWPKIFDRDMPRVVAYILGVLALALPLTVLFAVWALWQALLALWMVIVAGGASVLLAYALEDWLKVRIIAREGSEREQFLTDAITAEEVERRR